MLGLFTSPRKALVIAHDLLMTALAVLASFYIRFEAAGLMVRLDWLYVFLPCFVVYAGFVYFFFHLYESKWRFASLPDLMNILRAATVLAVSLLVLDYVSGRTKRLRSVLLRQDHHRTLLAAADGVPRRGTDRLSLFPLYPHQAPLPLAGV